MDLVDFVKQLRLEGFVEGEMSVDPLWYIIWEPENVMQYNEEYEIEKYAPGFAAFGHNGANELLAVDKGGMVYRLPAIGMSPSAARKIADSLDELKLFMQSN